MSCRLCPSSRQAGSAAVEFALVATVFFAALLGIMEFGRLFYVNNTLQEVTRFAAREQSVRAVSTMANIKKQALFCPSTDPSCSGSSVALPAGAEITNGKISLTLYNTYSDAAAGTNAISPSGVTATGNLENCMEIGNTSCVRFVRARIQDAQGNAVSYVPMLPLFSFLNVSLPGATVVLPAEALGL